MSASRTAKEAAAKTPPSHAPQLSLQSGMLFAPRASSSKTMLARAFAFPLLLSTLFAGSCSRNQNPPIAQVASASASTSPPGASTQGSPPQPQALTCEARRNLILASPVLPGAPEFDKNRVEILGRARGEPVIFLKEPAPTPDDMLSPRARTARTGSRKDLPGTRIVRMARSFQGSRSERRALILREGYVYASDPLDALALVTTFKIQDLFDEATIYLMRASSTFRLTRDTSKKDPVYRYADGSAKARIVDLTFADRFALTEAELSEPLHRDVKQLAWREGFDRMKIGQATHDGFLAELRFGKKWFKAIIDTNGATSTLRCIDEEKPQIDEVLAHQKNEAWHRLALSKIRSAVSQEIDEVLRFDRPEGVKTAEEDGRLRPGWLFAYKHGQTMFSHEKHGYAVYDPEGRAWPPQVCVDFVLDTFERASGTWFTPKSESPERTKGKVDFDSAGITNRRSVLAFGQFASEHGELFQARRIPPQDRVAFQFRTGFFNYLVEHADDFRDADIVAIQGTKKDGLIHQHAILVESLDPVTGFAYGLADQMHRPRRRTWEGIMAEAPLRSLLYHVRLNDKFFTAISESAVKANN